MAWMMKLICGRREVGLIRATANTPGWTLREGGGGVSPVRGDIVYGGLMLGGGARRTGSTTPNRDVVLTLSVQNQAGRNALLKTVRQLSDFFQEAKLAQEVGARDAVYLMRQLDEGFTGTTLFGRGPVYHEVLAGYLDVPASVYSMTDLGGNNIVTATLTLTCYPLGVGKPTFMAEAAGWQRFADDGEMEIWEGTTNLFRNPSFENTGAWNAYWAASDASLVTAVEYERIHLPRDTKLFQAARLCNTSAAVRQWTSTVTLTAATYALSCYVYTDGGQVSTADCQLWAGVAGGSAVINTTFVADPLNPGWYRAKGTFTGDAVARTNGIEVKAGKTVIVDNFQLELKAACTPFALSTQGPGLAYDPTLFDAATWQLLLNPGFETLGAGGADVFANWNENAGSGTIAAEGAIVHSGARSCKITGGAGAWPAIDQTVTVYPNTLYTVSVWTRGSGAVAGMWGIADDTAGRWLIAPVSTGVTAAAWAQVSIVIRTPPDCVALRLALVNGTNAVSVYFDDAAINAGPDYDNAPTIRTAGQWRVRTKFDPHPGYEVLFYGGGALSMWVTTEWAGNDGVLHYLLACQNAATTHRFLLCKSGANDLAFEMWGSTVNGYKTLSGAVTGVNWAANVQHHVFITWDESGPLSLYLDGVLLDNTPTATGTWTNLSLLGSYVYVSTDTSGGNCVNGVLADLRIWGPDFAFDPATPTMPAATPATLYAHGCGKSEFGTLWTKTLGGTLQSTEDASNSNAFWVGGVPGDEAALLRLFTYNHTLGGSCYLSFHRPGQFPYRLNVSEAENYYAYDSGGAAPSWTVDASRSGGAYKRNAAGTAVYGSFHLVIADSRLGPLLAGRYHVLAVVRDAGAGTYWQGGVAQNTYGNTLATVSKHVPYAQDKVYSSGGGGWEIIDLGIFNIPQVLPQDDFAGQTRKAAKLITWYSSFMVTATANAVANLDLDYLVFMPADRMLSIGGNAYHGLVSVVNAIGKQSTFVASETATLDISMEETDINTFSGNWPMIAPRVWTFGNILASTTPANTINLYMIYQARYLWGR